MRKQIFLLAFLVILADSTNGQLNLDCDGNTILGPTTSYSDYRLNNTGSGTNGSGGRLGFGENSTT